jgi:hypothetical protein
MPELIRRTLCRSGDLRASRHGYGLLTFGAGFSQGGHLMGLIAKLDWASSLNIAAVCASLAFIGAVVAGVF